jgi:iron complex transport system ATP-binding protein
MNTVILKDLSIGYTAKGNEKVVASGLNAAINSGELTCLLGQNGIGKSTLLRTLSAFLPKLGGKVMLKKSDVPDYSELSEFSDQQLSRMIGVVLTEKLAIKNMTAEELIGMGRAPYTGFWGRLTEEDHQVVREAIRLVGIESLAQRMIQTLSDGERQKVMIAKALAQQTPIIYLDEPTAFLDYPSKVEMMQLLRRLAVQEQKTIFLSTHDVELSLQVADCIWLMEGGATPTKPPQGEASGHSPLGETEGGLHVGTPRQLAEQGALSRFIEREGITFDRSSLTIRIEPPT